MKVRDIMTTEVATAEPDSTLQEIAAMMKDEDTGAIPVLDEDQLIGIITDRDIVLRCVAAGHDCADVTADDIISDNVETVEPDADVDEAVRLMAHRQIRRLPVCDNGKLVGMLSLGDIAVKQSDDEAGEALEDISEGVKQGRRSPPPAEPARAAARQQADRKRVAARQDMERGEGGSGHALLAGEKGQGIGNHDVNEENRRQAKVVPFRNAGPKRRVS